MTMDEAARATELQIPRAMIAQLADDRTSHGNVIIKRELLIALKTEAMNILKAEEEKEDRGGRQVGGAGRGVDG